MSAIERLNSLREDERNLLREKRKLDNSIYELEDEIKYAEDKISTKLAEHKQAYVDEQTKGARDLYQPKIDECKAKLDLLNEKMEQEYVDDSPELAAARDRKEYLDTVALSAEQYLKALKEVSTDYFIDIAYTEKRFNVQSFKVAYTEIPSRIEKIHFHGKDKFPKPFNMFIKHKNLNIGVYLGAIINPFAVAFTFPKRIKDAVDRAHYLHQASIFYHKLMHTLVSFQSKTDAEINLLFKTLLQSKRQKLVEDISRVEDQMEKYQESLNEACADIEFDEDLIRSKEIALIAIKKGELSESKKRQTEFNEQLKEIRLAIDEAKKDLNDTVKEEYNRYFTPQEYREVVIPTQLIYDSGKQANIKADFIPGLYIFEDREIVFNYIQLTMFQLRNIMAWGSIQFRVMDLLSARQLIPLMLSLDGKAKNQDIFIYSLREERTQMVETMHDFLQRRSSSILKVTKDIGSYNKIQEDSGSAPIPYQIVYIVLEKGYTSDEKLSQLIALGYKLGIYVLIFINSNQLDSKLAKSLELYFEHYIELTDSGITVHEPKYYIELLEQVEAERKRGI